MFELIYTSAPQGLRAGASGYTVVAQTNGIPASLAGALEGLCQYRHRHVGAVEPSDNPVIYGHYLLTVGFQRYHVVSRIVDSGLDYTGRGNFLAHHLAVTDESLPSAGPGWVVSQPNVFQDRWDRPPCTITPRGKMRGDESISPKPCRAWEAMIGDAGWGGVLAAATDPARPAVVIFEPGQDVLPLISEALALLPPAERWQVSFSSYYLGTPAGVRCQWRFIPSDSPDLSKVLASGPAIVIRTDRRPDDEPEGPLVETARSGKPASPTPRIVPGVSSLPTPSTPYRASTPSTLPGGIEVLPVVEPESEPESRPYRSLNEPGKSVGISQLLLGLLLGGLGAVICLIVLEAATKKGILGLVTGQKSEQVDTKASGPQESPPPKPNAIDPQVKKLESELTAERGAVKNATDKQEELEKSNKQLEKDKQEIENELKVLKKQKLEQAKKAPDKPAPAPEKAKLPPVAKPEMRLVSMTRTSDNKLLATFNETNLHFEILGQPSFVECKELGVGAQGRQLSWKTGKLDDKGKPETKLIGRIEYKSESLKSTLDISSSGNEKLPQLQAGLIKMDFPAGLTPVFFRAFTPPRFSPSRLLRQEQNGEWILSYDSDFYRNKVETAINDYGDYIKRGGEIGLTPYALLLADNETIRLSPPKPTSGFALELQDAKNEIRLKFELPYGHLVVKSKKKIVSCELLFAEVVRPVNIEGFEPKTITVFQIGTP